MKLGGHEYMMVQQIYTTFGPAASVLAPGAIVVSAVLAFLVRRRWPPFALTFGAAVALAAALGVWGALVYPVNQRWAELPPRGPAAGLAGATRALGVRPRRPRGAAGSRLRG